MESFTAPAGAVEALALASQQQRAGPFGSDNRPRQPYGLEHGGQDDPHHGGNHGTLGTRGDDSRGGGESRGGGGGRKGSHSSSSSSLALNSNTMNLAQRPQLGGAPAGGFQSYGRMFVHFYGGAAEVVEEDEQIVSSLKDLSLHP